MKFYIPTAFLLIIFSGYIASHHNARNSIIVDAYAGATKNNQTPTFSGKVVSGPDILNGARLLEGETSDLLVTIGNPWTNNKVSLTFSPQLQGATLTQKSATSWLFSWTLAPGGSSTSNQQVTFKADFYQMSGSNAGTHQVYSTYLNYPLGAHQPPVFAPIQNQNAQIGQLLSFPIFASSPEDESVKILSADLPVGATLSDTVKSGSKWSSTFSWTPTESDLGPHSITLNATDSFNGTNNSTIKPLTITVFSATSSTPEVKSIQISSAKWNKKKSVLKTTGKLTLTKKSKLPSGTQVSFSSLSDPSTSLGTANVSKNLKWNITFPLTVPPCTLVAQVIVNNVPYNTPVTRAVTGSSGSCN